MAARLPTSTNESKCYLALSSCLCRAYVSVCKTACLNIKEKDCTSDFAKVVVKEKLPQFGLRLEGQRLEKNGLKFYH